MNNIITPNVETFQFTNMKILPPLKANGGAYFTKIEYNNKPLYIQTCKSSTKNGIIKSGKRYFCDIMFDATSEEFIQWLEHLEITCQELIYKKKNEWFSEDIELNDIENAFISPIKLFKSGKYYLLRSYINTLPNSDCDINVFHEIEKKVLTIDDVTNEKTIISILEIQGIKFTQNKFQIEIVLKSIVVLEEKLSFQKYLFQLNNYDNHHDNNNKLKILTNFENDNHNNISTSPLNSPPKNNNEVNNKNEFFENDVFENHLKNDVENETKSDPVENMFTNEILNEIQEDEMQEKKEDEMQEKKEDEMQEEVDQIQQQNEIKEKDEIIPKDNLKQETNDLESSLEEIQINDILDLNEDSYDSSQDTNVIKLKEREEIYYNLYRKAKIEAKNAKKKAILAYLNAKNIHETHLLNSTIFDKDDETFEKEFKSF
jgi:hypothetical protein